MADVVDQETRSRMMSGIRGKDTKPERDLHSALEGLGIEFETHDTDLPGRPDIVLNDQKVAILVHGCFWHRHEGCRFTTTPATRTEFWLSKFEGTVARDKRNLQALHEMGWRTATVWECALRHSGTAASVAGSISKWLDDDGPHLEIGGSAKR